MTRSGLYLLTGTGVLAGYAWLAYHWTNPGNTTLCLMKGITGVPCPSCGVTRSVQNIFIGNHREAFGINPLGFVLFGLMMILPVWIIYDLIFRRQTMFVAYTRTEQFLKKKKGIGLILIMLILAIWLRNIYNGI